MDALMQIKAEDAEANNAEEKKLIDVAIRAGCGFAVLNNTVKDKLRVWHLTTGVDRAEILIREDGAVVDTVEFGTFANNLGRALLIFGKSDKALEYFQRALKINVVLFGEQHSDTASSLNSIGSVYDAKGDHVQAFASIFDGL